MAYNKNENLFLEIERLNSELNNLEIALHNSASLSPVTLAALDCEPPMEKSAAWICEVIE